MGTAWGKPRHPCKLGRDEMFWPFNTQRGAIRFAYRMVAEGHKCNVFYCDKVWKVFVR
jgi:hypothetical protein